MLRLFLVVVLTLRSCAFLLFYLVRVAIDAHFTARDRLKCWNADGCIVCGPVLYVHGTVMNESRSWDWGILLRSLMSLFQFFSD